MRKCYTNRLNEFIPYHQLNYVDKQPKKKCLQNRVQFICRHWYSSRLKKQFYNCKVVNYSNNDSTNFFIPRKLLYRTILPLKFLLKESNLTLNVFLGMFHENLTKSKNFHKNFLISVNFLYILPNIHLGGKSIIGKEIRWKANNIIPTNILPIQLVLDFNVINFKLRRQHQF